MESKLEKIQKGQNKERQQTRNSYEIPNPKSSIKILNKRIMKICEKCDMVFEKEVNHRHTGMKFIIMRNMQCNHCKKYFNIVNCTCQGILSGIATLSEYESRQRNTIKCENCNRFLIFKKQDFTKHNWEVYEQHRANIKLH